MNKPKNITKIDWELLSTKYPNKLHRIVKKINNGYPIQYLIGDVNFFGHKIIVNKNVFIPRVETELLVEKTINKIKTLKLENKKIVDICSGSGCIAITLSKELNKDIDAFELSKKAIKVAIKSNKINNANVKFYNKDILKEKQIDYDVIVCNPPYVPINSAVDIQTKYEPQQALFPKKDEIQFYKHILSIVKKDILLIAFEIAHHQGKDIVNIIKKELPNHKYSIEKDYTKRERFIFVYKSE